MRTPIVTRFRDGADWTLWEWFVVCIAGPWADAIANTLLFPTGRFINIRLRLAQWATRRDMRREEEPSDG